MTSTDHADRTRPAEAALDDSRAPDNVGGPDRDGLDQSPDPEDLSLEDVLDAEDGRPDLPDETIDGLGDVDEEVRRQAEDLTTDRPRRL